MHLNYYIVLVPLTLVGHLLTVAVIKEIKEMLHNIHKTAKKKKNLERTLKHISEYVQLHSDLKQLIKFLSNISLNQSH